ncbi:unnamed protein product [Choristocarpus tenellus]
MRIFLALCCVLLAQGGRGFMVPLPVRTPSLVTSQMSGRMEPAVSMSTKTSPKFSIPLMDDTRVTIDFDKDHCKKLASEVNNILSAFKRLKENAASGGKPYREEGVEYRDTIGDLNLLVECNPNIFPDPFKAQVFVRVWDDKMEVSSQAMLTSITDAIKQYIAKVKAEE